MVKNNRKPKYCANVNMMFEFLFLNDVSKINDKFLLTNKSQIIINYFFNNANTIFSF